MPTKINAYRSKMGRLFETEADAIADETNVERMRQLAKFFDRMSKRHITQVMPPQMIEEIDARRDELVKILQTEKFTKESNR